MVQGVGGGWRRKWGSPEEDRVGGKVVHSSGKATHTGLTPWVLTNGCSTASCSPEAGRVLWEQPQELLKNPCSEA